MTPGALPLPRSAWRVTLAVWHALLMREAVARLTGKPAALAWLFLEPLAYIGMTLAVFILVRAHAIGGMDTAAWLACGLLGYLLFRRTATQGAQAVAANKALYTYRQVLPVDTVLVRCSLEALLMVVTAALVSAVLGLAGHPLVPQDPATLAAAMTGLWALALGWALTMSVLTERLPTLARLPDLLMMPLMLVSGVVAPLSAVPTPWREALMLNPVAHGIEGLRAGLSVHYHHAPELDLFHLHAWALALVWLGLALHVRWRNRLVSL